VGEAAGGREAVAKALQMHLDIVFMDIAMPDLSGCDATRRILQSNPKAKIIILTMYEEEEVINRCLAAGASGYVLKDAPRAHLIHAIDVVNKGGQYMSSRALKKLVRQYVKGTKTTASSYDRLSDGEREILKLLADGLVLKDIANQLVLSVKTVDAHKTNLMRKLDLHDRAGLIKYAIQRKLIRLPPVRVPAETLS
jgi:two-component system, NarL family, response regulator NreC